PSVGKAGGILLLWKRALVSFAPLLSSQQCVAGRVQFADQPCWNIAVIYADKDLHVRRSLWASINSCRDAEIPLLAIGDFNCILSQDDKKGGRPFRTSAASLDMEEFIRTNDLVDPGFLGPKFTWSNNKDGLSKIWARLDRCFISTSLLEVHQEFEVRHLLRLASDHCPLLCSLSTPSRFQRSAWIRFEDMWLSYPAAGRIVSKCWHWAPPGGPADVLQAKCRRTLRHLFFWSRNKIQGLHQLQRSLELDIAALQVADCSPEGLSPVQEVELLRKVRELNSTLARITTWWQQRAKVRWLEEGDANTHYFHSVASSRRRGNRIREMTDEGGTVSGD
ncbi:uncharacterized protein LOC110107530, partial [Dendrobium catenatum]|uniref:uncharacterized protein LOC110107530 n=1 Tax=Dendrobium catenatum TaxID=906689 RepID=UPI0009F3A970